MSEKLKTEKFIERANIVHKNKYDYSKTQYINAKTNVFIICNTHGGFFQIPHNHLRGSGCMKCGFEKISNHRKESLENFLKKAIRTHGNRYEYNKVIYKKATEKVIITCKIHGDFLQKPTNHTSGSHCPKCVGVGQRTLSDFIEKAISIHGKKYDYSKVDYTHSGKKVEIICSVHGSFFQRASAHLLGQNCPSCVGNQKITTEEFIKKAKNIYGDKYDYTLTNYINKLSIIDIICNKHGVFKKRASDHLTGTGCTLCSNESLCLTQDEFIRRAKEKHGELFDYKLTVFKKLEDKIIIICKKHGKFKQTAYNHLKGGCLKCENESRRSSTEEYVKKAIKVHGNKYNYDLVNYVNNDIKIKIVCKKHGFFYQIPSVHLFKHGCPKCNSSKGELLISNFLTKNNIEFEPQKKFKTSNISKCRFDFYLPLYKLLIEYNGGQHYDSIKRFGGIESLNKTQLRDQRKKDFAHRNGYHFLEIPYFSKDPIKMIENKIKQIETLNQPVINNQLQLAI